MLVERESKSLKKTLGLFVEHFQVICNRYSNCGELKKSIRSKSYRLNLPSSNISLERSFQGVQGSTKRSRRKSRVWKRSKLEDFALTLLHNCRDKHTAQQRLSHNSRFRRNLKAQYRSLVYSSRRSRSKWKLKD